MGEIAQATENVTAYAIRLSKMAETFGESQLSCSALGDCGIATGNYNSMRHAKSLKVTEHNRSHLRRYSGPSI